MPWLRLLRELGQESGDQTREDVAASARAHSRSAGRIDPDAAIGKRQHSALSFEHHRDRSRGGIRAGGRKAVLLDVGRGLVGQTSHFARMGR